MSEAEFKKCDAALVKLQKKAKGKKEVTIHMVKKAAGMHYCTKVLREAFRDHGKPRSESSGRSPY